MTDDIKLGKLDRIFLINQLRILEVLYPEEAKDMSVQREALERGYEMLYPLDFQHVYVGNDTMSVDESREVWDTMDMFDGIQRSLAEMPEDYELPKYSTTKFLGYDGNTETKFMSFARFTVERLERFEYVPMEQPGYWNSHRPVRDVYQRMLEVWRDLPHLERFSMSKQQLDAVLGAQTHPEWRDNDLG